MQPFERLQMLVSKEEMPVDRTSITRSAPAILDVLLPNDVRQRELAGEAGLAERRVAAARAWHAGQKARDVGAREEDLQRALVGELREVEGRGLLEHLLAGKVAFTGVGALGVGLAGVAGFNEWSPVLRRWYGFAVVATGVVGAVAAGERDAKKEARRIGGELRQSRYASRDSTELRRPEALSGGWFFEANLNAHLAHRVATSWLTSAGVRVGEALVTFE